MMSNKWVSDDHDDAMVMMLKYFEVLLQIMLLCVV